MSTRLTELEKLRRENKDLRWRLATAANSKEAYYRRWLDSQALVKRQQALLRKQLRVVPTPAEQRMNGGSDETE